MSSQKGFLPIHFGVVVLIILVALGAYYLGTKQNNRSELSSVESSPATNTIDVPAGYKTRYFNLSGKFYFDQEYPTELTQISENSLIPMSCTPKYSRYGETFSHYDKNTEENIITSDESLLHIIQLINDKYGKDRLSEIFSCTPKDGDPIIIYSLEPCGGGCIGIPYLGVVEGSEINEMTKIDEVDKPAYFGCRQPLQLTKDNVFYFECGGGDGPSGSGSIFKYSLVDQKLSRIKRCISGPEENAADNFTVSTKCD